MRLISTDTDQVIRALAAACGEIPTMKASHTNDTYQSTYIGLDDVLAAVIPILTKHGLWTSYGTRRRGNRFRIEQRIHHIESQQHYGTEVTFDLQSGAPHEIASLMTYGRRYLMQLALNLAPGDDDDGNRAQREVARTSTSKPSTTLEEYQGHLGGTAPISIVQEPKAGGESPQLISTDGQGAGSKEPPPVAGSSEAPQVRGAAASPSDESRTVPMSTPADATHAPPSVHPPRADVDKPRVNQAKVQRAQLMATLYGQFKQTHGKEKAESALQDLVGTTYLKFVTPDKYEIVIAGLTTKLAATPAA